jgi:hypothetical protein
MPQKVYAAIGEREGYLQDECTGSDCAVATFGDVGLAIIGLVVLVLILWAFEKLSKKFSDWQFKKHQQKNNQTQL